ncbi:MAG: hypothetical protein KJO07_17155 [Deltaproteobacteria bacterium]|nr:hypothetical protein [Deltaproteobacteria bacterium]
MRSATRLCVAATTAFLLVPSAARSHEVRATVTTEGWKYLTNNLPELVPSHLELETAEKDLPGCLSLKQRDTTLDISDLDVDVEFPRPGAMRLELELSAVAEGIATIEGIYACLGAQSCSNRLAVDNANVAVELEFTTNGNDVIVDVVKVDLNIDDDEFSVKLCDGLVGSAIGAVTSTLKNLFFGYLADWAEGVARDKLAVVVSDLVSEYATLELEAVGTRVRADLLDIIAAEATGLSVGVDIDLDTDDLRHSCVSSDVLEPELVAGEAPAVSTEAHMALAINVGLINDAFYQAWYRGLTCIDERSLGAMGIELDLHHLDEELGKALPGLPPGTHFGIDVTMAAPPTVTGLASDGLGLSLTIPGLRVAMNGKFPDGSEGVLALDLDLEAQVHVRVDPATGAISVKPGQVYFGRLEIDDYLMAEDIGFDAAAIRDVLENRIIPGVLADLGEVGVTGSVFGGSTVNPDAPEPFPGASRLFVIVHDLVSNDAFLGAELRLFLAPEDDDIAPTTELVSEPARVVNPRTARIVVSGTDDKIPTELLRYRVTANDELLSEDFVREIRVGKVGETAEYELDIRAMDLAGNTDTQGLQLDLVVDGIAPQVFVRGDRKRTGDSIDLEWDVSDDYTPSPRVRIDVFRWNDPTDAAAVEMVDSLELEAGATETNVELDGTGTFRVEVVATDEAGNETASSVTVKNAGGCNAGGGTGLPAALAFLSLLLIPLRRRRAVR